MDNKDLKILSETIRDLRKKKNLSQRKLGLKILKDQQSIHKLEKSNFNPTFLYLLEICQGLEINLSDLILEFERRRKNNDLQEE